MVQAAKHQLPRAALVVDRQRQIEDDAALDGISRTWAWAGFWFPPAGLVALGFVFVLHRPWLYLIQQEDYPLEWMQFGLCLFCGLVFAPAAARLAARGHRGLAFLVLLVALGSVVLAGEEISWGQRVFGLATPDDLAGINHQAETNVHNVNVGVPLEDLFKLFALAMGAGGAGLALLVRRVRGPLNRTSWWLVAPPLLTVPGFLMMALYRVFIFIAPVNPAVRSQEWVEVGLYTSLAVTAGCCYARAGADRYLVDLRGARPRRTLNPAGRSNPIPVTMIGVGVLVLTLVFAYLTTTTDIRPGNI